MMILDPKLEAVLDYFDPQKDRLPGQPQTPFQSGREPLPIIFNSTANLEGSYTQTLAWDVYIPDLPKQPTRQCTPKLVVNECDCRRFLVPSTCMCKDCTNCAPWVQARTADSFFRRFKNKKEIIRLGGNRNYVCYSVFTIPPHLRDKFLDPKTIKPIRKAMWLVLKKTFGAVFGVEATHPIGSKSLMFAPHLNFVWVVRKDRSPFLDTDKLNRAWADILHVETVDVWHQYTDKDRQLYKWCEYVGRPFPGYTYWKGAIRWYGLYPKAQRKQDYICAECGCYIRRIGTIEASVVADYYAHGWLIGLDPPWYNNNNITRCRGSTKHGTTTGFSEGSLLRTETACVSETRSVSSDRQRLQQSFA